MADFKEAVAKALLEANAGLKKARASAYSEFIESGMVRSGRSRSRVVAACLGGIRNEDGMRELYELAFSSGIAEATKVWTDALRRTLEAAINEGAGDV